MPENLRITQLSCGYGSQAWWFDGWQRFVADVPREPDAIPEVRREWPHRQVDDPRWGAPSGLLMPDDPEGMLNELFLTRQREEWLSFEDLYALARAPWNAAREGVDVALFNSQDDQPIVWWPASPDLESGDLVLVDLAPREPFDPQRLSASWWERNARHDAEFVSRTDRLRQVTHPGMRRHTVNGGLLGICRVRSEPLEREGRWEVQVDRFIPFPHELPADGPSGSPTTPATDVRSLPEILGGGRGQAAPGPATRRWEGADGQHFIAWLKAFDWSGDVGDRPLARRDVEHFRASLDRLLDQKPPLLPRYLGATWHPATPATARRRNDSDPDAVGALTLQMTASSEGESPVGESPGDLEIPAAWSVVWDSPRTRTGQDPVALLPPREVAGSDGAFRITFVFDALLQGARPSTAVEWLGGTASDLPTYVPAYTALRMDRRHLVVVVPLEDADVAMGAIAKALRPSHQAVPLTTGAQVPGTDDDTLRILVVATEWHSREGGISTLNRGLCSALAAAGARVECLVGVHEDAPPEDAHPVVLTRVIPRSGHTGHEAVIEALAAHQPKVAPDVVIGHGHITGRAAHSVADALAHPVVRVHVVHTRPIKVAGSKAAGTSSGAVIAGEKKLAVEIGNAGDADVVCGVGPNLTVEARRLLAMEGASAEVYEIVPAIEETLEPRQKPAGLGEIVYTLGRVKDPAKGTELLVEAMERLEKVRDGVELVIRGVPADGADAERAQLGERLRRIQIRPYDTDARSLERDLRIASVMCMPSLEEGFGLVALEAISFGVPVLVDSESGIARLLMQLDPSDTAIVTRDPANPSLAWEQKLAAALDHADEQHQRALARRERLLEHTSWTKTGAELLEVLRTVAAAKTATAVP